MSSREPLPRRDRVPILLDLVGAPLHIAWMANAARALGGLMPLDICGFIMRVCRPRIERRMIFSAFDLAIGVQCVFPSTDSMMGLIIAVRRLSIRREVTR